VPRVEIISPQSNSGPISKPVHFISPPKAPLTSKEIITYMSKAIRNRYATEKLKHQFRPTIRMPQTDKETVNHLDMFISLHEKRLSFSHTPKNAPKNNINSIIE
jgi:hypothetical protein